MFGRPPPSLPPPPFDDEDDDDDDDDEEAEAEAPPVPAGPLGSSWKKKQPANMTPPRSGAKRRV
jgi:hypothetical protein